MAEIHNCISPSPNYELRIIQYALSNAGTVVVLFGRAYHRDFKIMKNSSTFSSSRELSELQIFLNIPNFLYSRINC